MGPIQILLILLAAQWAVCWWLVARLRWYSDAGVSSVDPAEVSVIIPARNEAHNLPKLLGALSDQPVPPMEVIVMDDGSDDGTATVARKLGAIVAEPGELPEGWLGKAWACSRGAMLARGKWLLFLDADTWFEPGGLEKLLATHRSGALAVIPCHVVRKPYEELSAFFNLLMALGTVPQGLAGQCLLISREDYDSVEGHGAVRFKVLENVNLAPILRCAGVSTSCMVGKDLISFRMYPEGLRELMEGWTKGFAAGATSTPKETIILISVWISALIGAAIVPFLNPWGILLYLLFVVQLGWMLRKVGSFSWLTALIYPVPLSFYLIVFVRSLGRAGKNATWKGRKIHDL